MISRRQSLQLLVAAELLAPSASAADFSPGAHEGAAAAVASLDMGKPADVLAALVKLRAGTAGELAVEWLKGVQYGVVDAVLTPFFTLNAVTLSRYRPGADGSYVGRRLELTWHGDLSNNRPLREFTNPYNGRRVEVPAVRTGPLPVVINSNGLVFPPRIGEQRLEGESGIGPVFQSATRLWIRLDTGSRVFAPGTPQPVFVYNETTTYQGSLKQVGDPEVTMADCQVSYTSVLGWKPWMQMGNLRGHLNNSANGEKLSRFAALPPDMLDFLRGAYPDIYRDPVASLEPVG